MTRRKTCFGILVALALLAPATSVFGCPVCFGDSDAPIVKGVEMSVLFMMGITYFLISGGVVAAVLLRRRARRLNGEHPDLAKETSS